ncbi:MAG: DUF2062 domain-containing protein [Terracidiphilus sp.]|jgi:uncharacterized protein (DUF2062 family)
MRERLWRLEVVRPILEFLRQGLTPEKLSFTIALGITLGVTPILGSTALLCTLAAIAFRLNLAAIQLVNWLVYPFQLALLIPFYRIGGWIFRTPPSEFSVVTILALIRTNLLHAIATLWTVTIHAVVAWLALGSMATGLLYLLLVPVLCGMSNQQRPETGERLC